MAVEKQVELAGLGFSLVKSFSFNSRDSGGFSGMAKKGPLTGHVWAYLETMTYCQKLVRH